MQEVITQVIDNHQVLRQINEDQQLSNFQTMESILARVTSLPVQNYTQLANNLTLKLVVNTEPSYHKSLIHSLFHMMSSLYDEKKRGKQESFKNKILYKISYLIAIIMYKTSDVGKIEVIN